MRLTLKPALVAPLVLFAGLAACAPLPRDAAYDPYYDGTVTNPALISDPIYRAPDGTVFRSRAAYETYLRDQARLRRGVVYDDGRALTRAERRRLREQRRAEAEAARIREERRRVREERARNRVAAERARRLERLERREAAEAAERQRLREERRARRADARRRAREAEDAAERERLREERRARREDARRRARDAEDAAERQRLREERRARRDQRRRDAEAAARRAAAGPVGRSPGFRRVDAQGVAWCDTVDKGMHVCGTDPTQARRNNR